jgi:hypothetical protein
MTNKNNYQSVILEMLQGQTEELRAVPRERLDWAGPAALIRLYRNTSGKDRSDMIRDIGQVIQDHPSSPVVIAQLIDIASGLDLAEVEPQVRKLQAEPFASQEPLRDAIINFLAFRDLTKRAEKPTITPNENGKPGIGRTKSKGKAALTSGQRAMGKLMRDES